MIVYPREAEATSHGYKGHTYDLGPMLIRPSAVEKEAMLILRGRGVAFRLQTNG